MAHHVRLCVYILLCIIFLFSASAHAQEDEGTSDVDETLITYGQVISGQIDNFTPYQVYSFEALRCDFISLRVTATGGNLDPVVTILDSSGTAILMQDDANGRSDPSVEPVSIPSSGRYQLIVGRFGYDLGTTVGSFELLIDRIGNGSAYGCALRYGDTVYNGITDQQPELIYSFRAEQGDVVNIRMERRTGELDPYLSVTDNAGFVLQFNDDAPGSGTDALIEGLLIPNDGIYYIFATRYGEEAGISTGNFILTLQEATGSGAGNSPLTAIPIRVGSVLEGEITDEDNRRYYRFEARQNDLITVEASRLSGNIDTLLILANVNLQELIEDDDGGGNQNSRIEAYLIPNDGTYYIIATRFEREAGTTAGRFQLELSAQGNAFDAVPPDIRRLSYGTSVTGSIDDVTSNVLYAFRGVEGDIVTLSLNRGDGDLDPYLCVLAEDQRTELICDDDGGNNQNALIERFVLPQTGVYYIRAGRFGGADSPNTNGSFVLILARRFD